MMCAFFLFCCTCLEHGHDARGGITNKRMEATYKEWNSRKPEETWVHHEGTDQLWTTDLHTFQHEKKKTSHLLFNLIWGLIFFFLQLSIDSYIHKIIWRLKEKNYVKSTAPFLAYSRWPVSGYYWERLVDCQQRTKIKHRINNLGREEKRSAE